MPAYKQKPRRGVTPKRIRSVLADGEWKRPYNIIEEGNLRTQSAYTSLRRMLADGEIEVARPGRNTRYGNLQTYYRLKTARPPTKLLVRIYKPQDG